MTDPMPPYGGGPYASGPAQQGNGLAIAGLVLGGVDVILYIIVVASVRNGYYYY